MIEMIIKVLGVGQSVDKLSRFQSWIGTVSGSEMKGLKSFSPSSSVTFDHIIV